MDATRNVANAARGEAHLGVGDKIPDERDDGLACHGEDGAVAMFSMYISNLANSYGLRAHRRDFLTLDLRRR
ncbi:hypothetical protein ABZ904_08555 [Streptomyces sp. NPDC046900]|uniref:hypothetical protein n=1 Tax=Streptomyces sp. NPDC046900 TaxID=3155473 RepID=UPI0033FE6C44